MLSPVIHQEYFSTQEQGHTSANEKIPTRKDAKDNEIICHDELKMQIILLVVTMTHWKEKDVGLKRYKKHYIQKYHLEKMRKTIKDNKEQIFKRCAAYRQQNKEKIKENMWNKT